MSPQFKKVAQTSVIGYYVYFFLSGNRRNCKVRIEWIFYPFDLSKDLMIILLLLLLDIFAYYYVMTMIIFLLVALYCRPLTNVFRYIQSIWFYLLVLHIYATCCVNIQFVQETSIFAESQQLADNVANIVFPKKKLLGIKCTDLKRTEVVSINSHFEQL